MFYYNFNGNKKKILACFTSANFYVTFEILKYSFTKVNFNSKISKKPYTLHFTLYTYETCQFL